MESEVKVLIIDDDDVFLFLHDLMVRDSGLSRKPLCFLSARHALEYLDSNYNLDKQFLVLLDINMPGLSGWQFLDYLETASYKDKVYVVLVTSAIELESHLKAETYSTVKSYIEKPLTDQLCLSLRDALSDKIKSL